MKLPLAVCLLLLGCKATEQAPNSLPVSPPHAATGDTTTALVQPARTLSDKLLQRPARPAYRVPVAGMRVGKKSTVSIYHGPATVTTTTIGKKAGPAIVASDSATQQVATNAVAGHGNTATQTATTKEAPGFWGAFGKPVGIALGLLLALAVAVLYARSKLPL